MAHILGAPSTKACQTCESRRATGATSAADLVINHGAAQNHKNAHIFVKTSKRASHSPILRLTCVRRPFIIRWSGLTKEKHDNTGRNQKDLTTISAASNDSCLSSGTDENGTVCSQRPVRMLVFDILDSLPSQHIKKVK